MKPCIDQWSTVLTGQWNPHIFTVDWVAKNLLDSEESDDIQIQLGVSRGLPSHVRLISEHLVVVPAQERIQFHPRQPSSDHLIVLERTAMKTLAILSHTPVTGYGINFHFTEGPDAQYDRSLFNAPDYSRLLSMKLEPVQRRIIRRVRVDDDFLLNMTLNALEEGGLDIDLNFHCAVAPDTDMKAFSAEMIGKTVPYYDQALEILKNVYKLNLEPEADTDD